jgi:hypothetical protein
MLTLSIYFIKKIKFMEKSNIYLYLIFYNFNFLNKTNNQN